MRKVREVLRLHFDCGCKHRQIAAACSLSPSTVSDYLDRAERAGLTWDGASVLSDAEVEARLFKFIGRSEPSARAAIDYKWVHAELARTGVTLQLLWGDYQLAAQNSGVRPYQYSQFCELYATWRDQRRLSMRQVHRPGEKLFLDYSGKQPRLCDPETGEMIEGRALRRGAGRQQLHVRGGYAHANRPGLHREYRAGPRILRRCSADHGAGPAPQRGEAARPV